MPGPQKNRVATNPCGDSRDSIWYAFVSPLFTSVTQVLQSIIDCIHQAANSHPNSLLTQTTHPLGVSGLTFSLRPEMLHPWQRPYSEWRKSPTPGVPTFLSTRSANLLWMKNMTQTLQAIFPFRSISPWLLSFKYIY
jgi:hypothetical protein